MKLRILIFSCLFFALIGTLKAEDEQPIKIVVLSVNDMHASIDRFPQFAALVDSIRSVEKNVLLFSGGDNQTGNPVNDQYSIKGLPMIQLMNKVGFSASVTGNHEYDKGVEAYNELSSRANFKFLAANVFPHDSLHMDIYPYRFFEPVPGIKVGVLGLLQIGPNGFPDTHPGRLKGITFANPLEECLKYKWMREQSTIFLCLTHLGFETDLALAEKLPEVDAILGGHSHTTVDKEVYIGDVLVTQAASHLKRLTQINFYVQGGKVIRRELLIHKIKEFPKEKKEIKEMVAKFNDNEALNKLIGKAAKPFHNKEELGSMICDALRDYSKADIALHNAGGVRIKEFPKGPMRIKDVYLMDPFGNEIILYELPGKALKDIIQKGWENDNHLLLYVSGFRYDITVDKDRKIKSIVLKDEENRPLDLEKTYKVALNSYMSSAFFFEGAEKGASMFVTTEEAIIDFISKKQNLDYEGVHRVNLKIEE